MNAVSLEISSLSDGVASLRIASDEKPYFERRLVSALVSATERLTADQSVRAIVLQGGTRYFSAGASREALLSMDAGRLISSYVAEVPRALLSLPVPTIAAMKGHAIGGGLALGLWCDIPVLAEESLYGANFMALGFTPGMGCSAILAETFGATLARELLFTGRLMTGRELRVAGGPLSHAVVPRREVDAHALAIAREIAEVPNKALRLLKQTLSARRREILERAVEEERAMHALLFTRAETQALIAERYPVPAGAVR